LLLWLQAQPGSVPLRQSVLPDFASGFGRRRETGDRGHKSWEGHGAHAWLAMKIGLVSDTHGYFDPKLGESLAGVNLILHAGDVGEDSVLHELRSIAPVHAVRGNIDSPDSDLPLSLQLTLDGAVVHVVHILPASPSTLEGWAKSERERQPIPKAARRLLHSFDPATEVVLFGHTHRPCAAFLGGLLWINPGSAGRKRFSLPRTCGQLEISAERFDVRIAPLEDGAVELPAPVSILRQARG
jgi:putative phosphoesterase